MVELIDIVIAVITLGLLPLLTIASLNCLFVKKINYSRCNDPSNTSPAQALPLVSCLIPARNEAGRIAVTLLSLCAQTYPNLEIIVLDDASTDQTAAVATKALHTTQFRHRIAQGKSLPADWSGKNFACHQLAELAQGDLLLFLDADVHLEPETITNIVQLYQSHGFALLTSFPQQICNSLSERMLVPLMELFLYTCAPIPLFNLIPLTSLVAANGQLMCFTRQHYHACGGHKAVKQNIVEDVALARAVKSINAPVMLVAGKGAVYCRMYESFNQILHGFGKNIFAACGFKGWILWFFVLGALLLLVAPFVLIFWSGWAIVPITLIILLRTMLALNFAQPLFTSTILHPLSIIGGAFVCIHSWYWYTFRKPTWKERTLSANNSKK
jgi:chlorobactene glucosyltransferase